jgi:tetratricopeptide (TPR) repeat protein
MGLEELMQQSAALADVTSEEAVEAQRAVLAIKPDCAPAAIRLGRVLTQLERYDEAEAAFRDILERDPGNRIARRRLEERPRRRRAPKPAAVRKRREAKPAGPRYWIKGVHYNDDGWTVAPGEETWISDIGRRDENGDRVHTADGTPFGRPSWSVGDEIGLYFSGTMRIPVVVEIIAPPEFNPAAVAERDGSAEEGERWPWVTHVRGVHSKPLDEAPTLEDLGMSSKAVQRLSRAKIDADLHARIVAALS